MWKSGSRIQLFNTKFVGFFTSVAFATPVFFICCFALANLLLAVTLAGATLEAFVLDFLVGTSGWESDALRLGGIFVVCDVGSRISILNEFERGTFCLVETENCSEISLHPIARVICGAVVDVRRLILTYPCVWFATFFDISDYSDLLEYFVRLLLYSFLADL